MNHRKKTRNRRGLALLPRALSTGLILWALAVIATGDHFMIIRIGLYAAPILMMIAAVLAVLAMVYKAKKTAIALLAVTAGLFATNATPLVRSLAPEPAIEEKSDLLRVISLSNRTMNLDVASTAEMVRAEDVDLFVLQEVSDPVAMIKAVERQPGRKLHHCHNGTFLLFSKYPLGAPLPDIWSGMMACQATLPAGPIWVGSVHLPRGITSKDDQDKVLDHLMGLLEEMPGPKIIAGDFNATPLVSPIQRMEKRLLNAFAQAGKGFGFTFPTPARRIGIAGPFLQIDYIFHSDEFQAVAAEVMTTHPPFADHFPIKAVLRPTTRF